MYPVGTIKLTWIDKKDYTILNSKMFSGVDLDKAILEGEQKGNYMLFMLQDTDKTSYTWKLLPYGRYKEFVRGMEMRDSLFWKIAGLSILGFAIYGVFKAIKK